MDVRDRVEQLRLLFDADQPEAAADALAGLWEEMADAEGPWRPLRASLLARILARAAAAGPGPRRTVTMLRDRVCPPQGPDAADHAAVREWCTLNIALGQADRTLSWLDRVESDPEAIANLRPLAGFIPYILRQAGQWPDMARWFADPIGAIRHAYGATAAWIERLDGDSAHLTPTLRAFARDRAALVYTSMLAAGRDTDALAAAGSAAQLDPEPNQLRMTLIATAVNDAGQARSHQLEWLEAAGDRGELALELREKVIARMGQAPEQG